MVGFMVIPLKYSHTFATFNSVCVRFVIFDEAKLNYKMLLIAFLFHFNCLDWLKTDMRNTFSSLVDKNKNQYWFRICVCGVSSHHASGTGESMPFSYKPNRNYRFRCHSHWNMNMNMNNVGLRRAQVAKHMNSQPIG